MNFRQAGRGDLDIIVDMTARAYAPHTEAFGYPPLPVTADYVPRVAAGEVWMLDDGDAPVGLIVLEREPARLTIFSIAVEPRRQGQGIGRRLLDFAEARAAAEGCATLALYTNARMTQNIALYEHCGFVETGRRPNRQRPGWTIVDMEKSLTPSAAAEARRTA